MECSASQRNSGSGKRGDAQQRRITALEEKLKAKNEMLSELMEKHVAPKRSLREI